MKGMACGKFRRHDQNWQNACDHEKRILWLVFCQNKFFWTRWSWRSIQSTYLSCWPIHVPSTRCIKWCEQQKYGWEQGKNQHTQTQLKWRSLCAPLDIVPLLLLFFLYFWDIVVFLGFFDFFFLFFDIFSSLRSTKEVTKENMSSNKW